MSDNVQVRHSRRKIRYDLDEVEGFAAEVSGWSGTGDRNSIGRRNAMERLTRSVCRASA